jgi:2-keto-3-deoxy-L-rhamnonate aldolase RhmA
MINTATEAERFVRSCRYPPHGFRGYAPTVGRMTSYGYRREEYFQRIESDLAIMVQIETEEAVGNAGDIAKVEGVHIVFIGPMDLSMNLGYPGQVSHPVVSDALRHVEAAVKQTGKALGTIVTPAHDVKVLIERGYRFIVPAGDIGLLRAGMEAQMKALRDARDSGRSI